MQPALALPLILLQLAAQTLANPVAASTLPSSPPAADTLLADTNPAPSQPPHPQNVSTVTRYPIEHSPLTLFLQATPHDDKIARADLVIALYDSREWILHEITKHGNSTLAPSDDPFNSTTALGDFVNCVVVVGSGAGAQRRLTYADVGGVVQGLLDVMLYPYRLRAEGVTFAVHHAVWGFVGSGAVRVGGVGRSA